MKAQVITEEETKEISRKVIGLVAFRIVRKGESVFCQKFESGGWKIVPPLGKHERLFDKRFGEWFESHANLFREEKPEE